MININVTGPEHAGKGHVIAAIEKALREAGCVVTVQLGETHNAKKLVLSKEDHAKRLNGVNVRLTEQQTSA